MNHRPSLSIVFLGLSMSSCWGNRHATVYRSLVRELALSGHRVLFLERDKPWYSENREQTTPPYGRTELYYSTTDLRTRFRHDIREADAVIIGSNIPDGIQIAQWVLSTANGVTAFYDLDTPMTVETVAQGNCAYLTREIMPQFSLYLSFTAGPTIARLENEFRVQRAVALPCSADAFAYYPMTFGTKWDLGYIGGYSEELPPLLDRLFLEPARRWPEGRFLLAGPQHPNSFRWPKNVERVMPVPHSQQRACFNQQRFFLNLTQTNLSRAGYSPSPQLFQAVACGTPVITDRWPGLSAFFEPGKEIIVADSPSHILTILSETSKAEAQAIGIRGRERFLAEHTSAHRAAELEALIVQTRGYSLTSGSSFRQNLSLF